MQLGLIRMHGQEPEVLQEAGPIRGQGERVQDGERMSAFYFTCINNVL